MDKVLVSIYVPSIEQEYNVYLPILYSDYDGKILNMNNIVKDCGIKKGCRLLLR